MASLGHVAIGLAAGRLYDPKRWRNAAVGFTLVSLWPDIDAIGFRFGVRYADPFGHRGASHALALAVVVALAAYVFARRGGLPATRTAVIAGLVAASHGILDTMTFGGGLGCALLWPISNERFWAPVRFIPVAPIGAGLLSARGLYVMLVELALFAPFWLYAVIPRRPKPDSR
ncbi:MAG: metal-dependent hydrolase [Deltaproteobacteria bacterium]|nr:metal-dependent hydrolase [Deltaproteobacteria bacterium]